MADKNEKDITQEDIDFLLDNSSGEGSKDVLNEKGDRPPEDFDKKDQKGTDPLKKDSKLKSSKTKGDRPPETQISSDNMYPGLKSSTDKNLNQTKTEKREKKEMEVLSQDEIDQLLNAISNGGSDSEVKNDSRKIKIYDFKRPDRFSKEQLRFMSNACEQVTREFSSFLSQKLSQNVRAYVCSVDQLTYEEFIRCIPTPTAMCAADWDVSDFPEAVEPHYHTIMEIAPALTLQILHGDFVDSVDYRIKDWEAVQKNYYKTHTLTDFEKENLKHVIFPYLYKSFTDSLNQLGSFMRSSVAGNKNNKTYKLKTPAEERLFMETNPQFAQIVSPTEMVILITIELKINDTEGMVNICVPYPFFRDILLKGNIIMSLSNTSNRGFGLQVIPGNATVSLGDFNVPEGAKMGEGMIIELDKLAGEPVDLVDKKTGKILAKGEVVVIDENFGVRVTEVLDESLKETESDSNQKE